jgi:hypothetical protein
MEQKPIKQRNMKNSTPKSEPSTEKMVLKAESVVEVKSKKQETPQKTDVVSTKTTKATKNTKVSEPVPVTVSAPVTASAPASKSKKTTEKAQVAQVQTAGQTQQTQPTKTAKGKQAAVQKTTAAAVVAKPSKKTEGKATATAATAAATPAPVQAAGAKTTKKTVKATKTVSEPVVKASKKVQKVNTEESLEDNKQLDDKLRYFKLYYNDNICGRYSGKKPKQAANKAFSSIIKDMKKTENKEGVNIDITFTIKECTRNSFHKEYKYVGKRLLLKSPVKVTIENGDGTSKDIVYKYHNELKKAPRA